MQHRVWNPKAFFRKVSPEVLARFEEERGLALERDPERPASEQTYHAWQALPDLERQALETELLPVNDMCSKKARWYLNQLARTVWSNGDAHLIEESLEWTAHDLALQLYLSNPDAFMRLHQSYAVDMMEHFREYRGKYPIGLSATVETKDRMRVAMADHFRSNAGGARCQVEDFESDDKFALFIYHEAEQTPMDRFNAAGVVEPDWQRPVVRIASVFYPETCTLLVKAPRKADREKLCELFAEIFVGDAGYFEDLNQSPKYSFAPLNDPEFEFATDPVDGIDAVHVVRLAVRSADEGVRRMTFDLEKGQLLDEVRETLDAHGVALNGDLVDGMRLQFTFQGTGRGRYRTVSVHNPNSSNLNDTARDRLIRRYLKEWSIDESRSTFAMASPDLDPRVGA